MNDTFDNNAKTEIDADALSAKISESGIPVDNAVVSALIAEEIETYNALQTCGVFPKEFGLTYGTGSESLIMKALVPDLPEPTSLPKMAANFDAAAPDISQKVTGLDSILKTSTPETGMS